MVDINEEGVTRHFLPGNDLPDGEGKAFVQGKFV